MPLRAYTLRGYVRIPSRFPATEGLEGDQRWLKQQFERTT